MYRDCLDKYINQTDIFQVMLLIFNIPSQSHLINIYTRLGDKIITHENLQSSLI